jgi:hypothetical protein
MTQPFVLLSQHNRLYAEIQMASFSNVLLKLAHLARPCMGKRLLLNSAFQCSCLMLILKGILSPLTLPSTIQQLLKTGVSHLSFQIFFPSSHLQLAGLLAPSTEVQTSMPTMWLTGPQLDSLLAAFPPLLVFYFLEPYLPVLERIPLFHF